MRMSTAIDQYCADMVADGRFNSPLTERSYRDTLARHAEDVSNRDPRTTNRDDVITTLRRWQRASTRSVHRSHLVSFYAWAMETGVRRDNPALQTRRPKTTKPNVYRLTRDEVRAFRAAARPGRERAIADFGLLTGLRADELLRLQGRHLRRDGWVWVSADIAKGKERPRWLPVLAELEATFARYREELGDQDYVLPLRQSNLQGRERVETYFPSRPMAYESLYRAVKTIGVRAGIRATVTPHLMRHAYGDFIARHAGIKVAQFVLGHASVSTTEGYTGQPTLDEVAVALHGFGYGEGGLPPQDRASRPLVTPAPGLGVLPTTCDPDRDWSRSGALLSPLLWYLWSRPAFREAARQVAADA